MVVRLLLTLVACCAPNLAVHAWAEHRVLLQGQDRLAIVEPNGVISWEMPWGGIHDIHLLDNGNILTRQGKTAVVEIDREGKQVVWRYDSGSQNGNAGKKVEVHAFERLPNGSTMIAESGVARIIEVDRDGELLKEIPLVVENPSTHSDTRLVRATGAGTYLVAHEADGKVREYDRETGEVVWEYRGADVRKGPQGRSWTGGIRESAFRSFAVSRRQHVDRDREWSRRDRGDAAKRDCVAGPPG